MCVSVEMGTNVEAHRSTSGSFQLLSTLFCEAVSLNLELTETRTSGLKGSA